MSGNASDRSRSSSDHGDELPEALTHNSYNLMEVAHLQMQGFENMEEQENSDSNEYVTRRRPRLRDDTKTDDYFVIHEGGEMPIYNPDRDFEEPDEDAMQFQDEDSDFEPEPDDGPEDIGGVAPITYWDDRIEKWCKYFSSNNTIRYWDPKNRCYFQCYHEPLMFQNGVLQSFEPDDLNWQVILPTREREVEEAGTETADEEMGEEEEGEEGEDSEEAETVIIDEEMGDGEGEEEGGAEEGEDEEEEEEEEEEESSEEEDEEKMKLEDPDYVD